MFAGCGLLVLNFVCLLVLLVIFDLFGFELMFVVCLSLFGCWIFCLDCGCFTLIFTGL